MKIEIKNDLFNIVNRLKQIDENYFVLFNLKNKKFELHNKMQGNKTYCLTFPFNTLDERAVEHAYKTSVKNASKIFFEIETQNKKIEEKSKQKILDECADIFNEIYKYSNAHTTELSTQGIYKTKWI